MTLSCLHPDYASNPYAVEIDAVLPRILALADRDGLSPTRGVLDRQFWAWKLIDFPNGTFQGATNGLSVLLGANALTTELDRSSIIQRIAEMFAATRWMTRRDGSLEEAFPHEGSYCVTALVAFDLLKSLDFSDVEEGVRASADPARVLEPLIGFLVRSDETHGVISNHLATAAAALFRWHAWAGDKPAREKAERLLDRILAHQSGEGWFSEYGGADPGYQTLCMTHLADIFFSHEPPDRLSDAMIRSARFLSHFVHPDGSFGGIYGSRATRIYYPGGMELLAPISPEAASISQRMRRSIAAQTTVPLKAMDQPNLIPVFNSYCAAFAASLRYPKSGLSAEIDGPFGRHHFPQAALIVDAGPRHQTVISTRKGVVYHWRDGKLVLRDTGIALRDGNGRLVTSQTDDAANGIELGPDAVTVSGTLRRLEHPLPGPLRFAGLRILAATAMRFPSVNSLIKALLVRYLIRPRRASVGGFRRTIVFGPDLAIRDRWDREDLQRVATVLPFSAIHMASQGYWQMQDDGPVPKPGGEAGEAE